MTLVPNRRAIFAALVCAGSLTLANAAVLKVGGTGNFTTLQAAVNAANSGDTIQVLGGGNTFDVTTGAATLVINKSLTIEGGYNATFTSTTQLPADTTLNAGSAGTARTMEVQGASTTVTFRYLTLDGANASGAGRGALLLVSGGATVNFNKANLNNNRNTDRGGAVSISTGTVNMTNVTASGNQATRGAVANVNPEANGVFNATDCTFSDNTGTEVAGIIYSNNNKTTLTRCTFTGNTSTYLVGTAQAGGNLTLDLCVFDNNVGGGVYLFSGGGGNPTGTILNTVLKNFTPSSLDTNGNPVDGTAIEAASATLVFNSGLIEDNPKHAFNIHDATTVATIIDASVNGHGQNQYNLYGGAQVTISGGVVQDGLAEGAILSGNVNVTINGTPFIRNAKRGLAYQGATGTVNGVLMLANGESGFQGGDGFLPSTVTLNGCTIVQNEGTGVRVGGFGGGNPSTFTFNNCQILENTGGEGGGVNVTDWVTVDFVGGLIQGNTATGRGGGILTRDGNQTVSLTNVVIDGNTAPDGGGIDHTGFPNTMTLTGCTFRNNTATGTGGGGLGVIFDSHFVAKNCVFENNTAGFAGGAIGMFFSGANGPATGVVDGCRFINNGPANGQFGPAIYAQNNVQVTVQNSYFEGNSGDGVIGTLETDYTGTWTVTGNRFMFNKNGGAMTFIGSYNADINDNVFVGNQGGAIYLSGTGDAAHAGQFATANVNNNLMALNVSPDVAGGLTVDGNTNSTAVVTARHNTIFGNRADDAGAGGGGVYVRSNGQLTLENSVVWNNTTGGLGEEVYVGSGSLTFGATNDIQNGANDVEGVTYAGLSVDPQFVNEATGNGHLRSTSPLLLSANKGVSAGVANDLNNNSRSSSAPTLGAYENNPGAAFLYDPNANSIPGNAGIWTRITFTDPTGNLPTVTDLVPLGNQANPNNVLYGFITPGTYNLCLQEIEVSVDSGTGIATIARSSYLKDSEANVVVASGSQVTVPGGASLTRNGDIDGNNVIDDFDLFALTSDFLSLPGSASGNTYTDLNKDGNVDDFDLFALTANFLEVGDNCN